MTRLHRIVLAASAAVITAGTLAIVGTAAPAGADCIGPTIEPITTELVRGEPVTVNGRGWGADCYDTGPPPPGQDTLGAPIPDIEVGFAQGASDVVVAMGSADTAYRFSVIVTVPTELVPGDATLWARPAGDGAGGFPAASPQPVVVSAAPVGADAPAVPTIAVFGPEDPAPAGPPTTEVPASTGTEPNAAAPGATAEPVVPTSFPMPTATSGPSATAVGATVVVVVLVIGLVVVAVRRRSPTDT